MTTRKLTGITTGGYTLSAAYTGVVVTAAAMVTGYTPSLGGSGGTGLTLAFAATLTNLGTITGGTGHGAQDLLKINVPAGAGGAAVDAAAGSTVTDIVGYITGGKGGAGDDKSGGGAGGIGVHAGAGSSVTDTLGIIVGGYGGAAGAATYTDGGVGGAGVDLVAGLITIDGGVIVGGSGGGAGGATSGRGGAGGAGAVLDAGGTVVSGGTVFGGSGGYGSYFPGGQGGAGVVLAGGGALRQDSGTIVGGSGGNASQSSHTAGVGGVGVESLASSTVVANGTIEGGYGGVGGYGSYDAGGAGGAAVLLAAGGLLTIGAGLIKGGLGGGVQSTTGYGGGGGDGVFLQAGGTVVNAGSISGGMGKAAYFGGNGGVGIGLHAGGTVINSGAITGGGAQNNSANPGDHANVGDGLYILDGGKIVNGGPGQPTALISGAVGVYALSGGGVTVINYGTIAGQNYHSHLGEAVEFGDVTDRLVVEAGSTFIEDASGGGGTLELATGKGTISGLGGLGTVTGGAALTFVEFGVYAIDAGSSWSLTGTNTVAASHTLTDAGTLNGAGTLALTGGAVTFTAGARLATSHVTLTGASSVTDAASLAYAGRWTQTAGTLSVASGQTATFTGTANTFAGTLAGAGTVSFAAGTDTLSGATLNIAKIGMNGATVTLSGSIANTSVASVTGGKLIVAAAGATLTGSGKLTLSDSAANLITGATAASRLTNGEILEGAGSLGGGSMALTNLAAGTIRSEGVNALIIDTGAATIVNAGLIESIGAGGATIASAVANTGRLYAQASTLTVEGAVSGTGVGQVLAGTLKFTATSVFNQNVTFASGATGTLELAHGQTYAGKISGFSKTGANRLDLDDIAFTSGVTKATYSGTTTSGVLTVTDGTHTAKIGLMGNFTTSTFTVSSDGHGGTTIVDPPGVGAARLVAAASSFGAKASGPIEAVWIPQRPEASHFLSVTSHLP